MECSLFAADLIEGFLHGGGLDVLSGTGGVIFVIGVSITPVDLRIRVQAGRALLTFQGRHTCDLPDNHLASIPCL